MNRILGMEKNVRLRQWFRENRIKLFYLALVLSSFMTLASTQGFFNLFFYALLVIVIVRMDEERFENLNLPRKEEMLVGILVCIGSFAFDLGTRGIFGGGYGQTDYTILVIGIILTFFGYRNLKKIYLPIVLVGGLSFALKLLQVIYDNQFDAVADWFVSAITGIAGDGGMGYPVYSGAVNPLFVTAGDILPTGGVVPGVITDPLLHLSPQPGTFTVLGINETGSLHVDWGCTGLRSLVMFSFILVALIFPLDINNRKKIVGIGIGIVGAFLINILRMVMLALIMYYYDQDAMMMVHQHLGDFLFIVWIGIYWWLFFRFSGAMGHDDDEEGEEDEDTLDNDGIEENNSIVNSAEAELNEADDIPVSA